MNIKSILSTFLILWISLGSHSLFAQSFFDNDNYNIPGNSAGYYCSDAAVSSADVTLSGLVGDNYIIDSVSISITHQDPDDLNISLISPRGKILNLSYRNGNSTDNAYDATIFTDLGGDISNTAPPFNGRFVPMGGALNDRFDGDLVTGEWTLEVCDINGGATQGVIGDFGIYFTELSTADINPVYEVNVSSTQFINVNLNSDCEHILTYGQALNGQYDQDGDGNIPPNDAFQIVVTDENPCNGPIIDGCGTFEYWINMPSMEPEIQRGFMGCTGGTNIIEGNIIADPTTQTTTIEVTPDNIVLTATATQADAGTVQAFASYEFPQSGQVGFRVNMSSTDAFDAAIISFDGTITPVELFATDNNFIQAQPLDVKVGDLLQFSVANNTDSPAMAGTATATISNFFFQPTVPNVPVTNFLPLGGFVTATDATPVEFVSLPTSPTNLFTAQLSEVLTTSIPASISRSYIVQGDGLGGPNVILNSTLDPALRAIIELGGGFPIVYDGCSDVEITVADQISSAGNCQDIVVTRTFLAREASGCTSLEVPTDPIRASYQLVFRRPSLLDVIPPMSVVEVDCDETSGIGNPTALVQDFPILRTINGDLYLDQPVDNVGATFTDGPRINTCANTYKFVRTYTVIDWCNVDRVLTFNQLIKVGDFGAPMITAPIQDLNFDGIVDEGPLVFSTNATGCTAFFDITAGVRLDDDCSDVTTLVGYVFPNGDFNAIPFGPFDAANVARDVPVGNHILQYIANDICGNADTLNVEISIADLSAPVAICENGLNVSLGGSGTAILMATDVNEASYDECAGRNLLFEIVRMDENNTPLGTYSSQITLACSDIGSIRVALRVTDDGNMNGIFEPGIDNSNICMAIIMVEDLGAPVCIAPSSFALTCTDLNGNFPEDLEIAISNDMIGTINLLNGLFGTATGIDNCPGSVISQTVTDLRNECGIGQIRRNFGVEDAQGFTSFSNCNQTISIVGSFDYTITFPADQTNMNCVEPDFNDISIMAGNCNTITMSTTVDTFRTSSVGCYLLRVTYEVIDICEMGTLGTPYVIPRDADNDGTLGEQVILRITPGVSAASISDDVAILDNDLNLSNGFINELDSGDGGLVNGSSGAGYGQDPSRGAFIYQQFITVIDNTGPTVNINETNNQAMDTDGNCEADFTAQFSIADECSMRDVTTIVDVDLFVTDQNNDGIITPFEFNPNRTVSVTDVTNTGGGDFTALIRDLPIGRHAMRVRASDGCGNTNSDIFIIEAQDATGPTISCINGLTATLSADETGGGIATIGARTFVVDVDNINDCSGTVTYAAYPIATATAPGFTPSPTDQVLTVTCEDIGFLPVRIYAFDPTGMSSFCETNLMVQAFDETICNPAPDPNANTPRGVIAGRIMTPFEQNKEGVEINIAAQLMGDFTTYTANDGTYIVEHLMEGDDFTIQPQFNPAVDLTEVSTGDLILMSRHILGLDLFGNPYQYVAADVNNDRRINVVDMIAIRRIILGLTQDFGQSNSWRFVSDDHNFNNLPENWLESNLMEVYNVNDLEGRMLSANFTAVELGNVSAATEAGNLIGPAGGRSDFALSVPLLTLEENSFYEVPFYQPTELLGFQTTIQLQPGLELEEIIYGTAGEGDFNLNYVANGLIGIAHVSAQQGNEPVFTLKLRATTNGQLDELLLLNDRIVTTESYAQEANYPVTAQLGLDFISLDPDLSGEANSVEISNLIKGFELNQNYPNPFQRETRIDYTLPVATEVILTVRDLQGRVVLTRKVTGISGSNHFIILRDDLKGAGGLLSYTVATSSATLTRKMLVTR